VIRSKVREIECFAGKGRFMAKINRRGFRVVKNSGRIIIICNRACYAGWPATDLAPNDLPAGRLCLNELRAAHGP